jgi:hypothetical protein
MHKLLSQSDGRADVDERHVERPDAPGLHSAMLKPDLKISGTETKTQVSCSESHTEGAEEWTPKTIPRSVRISLKRNSFIDKI